MRKLLHTLLLLPFCWALDANGQFMDVKPLQARDGLASNYVFDVEPDENGRLWVATNQGLSRYNGSLCITFSNIDGLASNVVTEITSGAEGTLWIGHQEGEVSYFNGVSFEHITSTVERATIKRIIPFGEGIAAVALSSAGSIWRITRDTAERILEELENRPVDLLRLSDDRMCLILEGEVIECDGALQPIKRIPTADSPGAYLGTHADHLFFHNHGDLYAIARTEAGEWSPAKKLKGTITPTARRFYFRSDRLWTINRDSLFQYQLVEDKIVAISSFSISDIAGYRAIVRINAVHHQLVLASKTHGLSLIETPVANKWRDASIEDSAIVAALDARTFVLASGTELNVFSKSNTQPAHWQLTSEMDLDFSIRAICGFSSSEVLVCSPEGHIQKLNIASANLSSFSDITANVSQLFSDRDGMIWVTTQTSGAFVLDRSGSILQHYNTSNELTRNNVNQVAQAPDGNYWLISEGTSLTILSDTGTSFFGADQGVPDLYITAIAVDADNNKWLSGESGNLYRISDGRATTLSPWKKERAGRRIIKIIPAGSNLVLVTNNEISLYDPVNDEILNTRSLATIPVIGSFPGSIGCVNDELVIANNGNLLILPTPLPDSTQRDQVLVEHWYADGSFYNDPSHIQSTQVTTLRISLDMVKRTRNEAVYWYRMLGIDSMWIGPKTDQVAQFTNLSDGEYKFQAGLGTADTPPDEFTSVSFTIPTPFYKQWWFAILSLMVAFASVHLFIKLRTKHLRKEKERLLHLVKQRTAKIDSQKAEIQTKNNEIIDSITYAKRIQKAILPPDKTIKRLLEDSFVLYKPKDIVAGDFYWVQSSNSLPNTSSSKATGTDDVVFFAAADCTGHGVPGAMVSVICNNSLNRAVREFGLHHPAEILDKSRELVLQEFETSEHEVQDGMDVALCAFNRRTNIIEFAGAHNPLLIVTQRDLLAEEGIPIIQESEDSAFKAYEIKADKQPVGNYHQTKPFSNHSLRLKTGDSVYVFSDGYLDQFGGPKGKRFKYSSLRKLFLSVQGKSMDEQLMILDRSFDEWRGKEEQIDDVCVIGMRV